MVPGSTQPGVMPKSSCRDSEMGKAEADANRQAAAASSAVRLIGWKTSDDSA